MGLAELKINQARIYELLINYTSS